MLSIASACYLHTKASMIICTLVFYVILRTLHENFLLNRFFLNFYCGQIMIYLFQKFSIFLFVFFLYCIVLGKSAEKTTNRKKNRGHRTSKIVKSTQSQSDDHLPYYCSLYYLAHARCMTWCVNLVRSKDAQKQLAQTSLKQLCSLKYKAYLYNVHE